MNGAERAALVIGAGPAGLAAADELVRTGFQVTVLEQDPAAVGGLARTIVFNGFRFDVGGHRFFSKNPEINRWWNERLGSDFIKVQRLTRIRYRGRFFHYPLRFSNVLGQLGPVESARCLLSYLKARLSPVLPEQSFEDWVTNRFGRRLFEIFFKTYTEKVWGMHCSEISPDWAAQRIRGLSFFQAIFDSLGLRRSQPIVKTLIDSFHYPRRGAGMIWEKTRDDLIAAGVQFKMGRKVKKISTIGGRLTAVEAVTADGAAESFSAECYLSTMPLSDLAAAFDPPLDEAARRAASGLRYRDFLLLLVIADQAQVIPDHWIYIHDPDIRLGRVAEFKNWSPEMAPDKNLTGLGLDYFSSEGDDLWRMSDQQLIDLGRFELDKLGILSADRFKAGRAGRVSKAYPVLDEHYKEYAGILRDRLSRLENLQLAGRNGMHKYNNQDHSMLTGIMAARAAAGEQIDPWKVNIDAEYLEEESPKSDSVRQLPQRDRG